MMNTQYITVQQARNKKSETCSPFFRCGNNKASSSLSGVVVVGGVVVVVAFETVRDTTSLWDEKRPSVLT